MERRGGESRGVSSWGVIHAMCILMVTCVAVSRAEHLTCVACEPGTYCFNDDNFSCPLHSLSPPGSGNISACVCFDGYYANSATHECHLCNEGFFCTGDVAFQCGAGATSDAGSSTAADCRCAAGFTGPNGQSCEACAPGTFKSTVGSSECSQCAPGMYSTTSGATNSSVCVACGDLKTSTVGSSSPASCVCVAGYEVSDTDDTNDCVACTSGKFSNASNRTCVSCALGSYASGSGATACTTCPIHSTTVSLGATSVDDCVCAEGFDGDGGVCQACGPGTHDSGSGCVLCGVNTYSSGFGAIECTPCPVDSSSVVGSATLANCSCDAGFAWTGTACTPCSSGHVKLLPGNSLACQPCVAGTFAVNTTTCLSCPVDTFQASTGADACEPCRASSASAAGSTSALDCLCLPGYAFVDAEVDVCEPCATGYYKTTLTNEPCTACASGYSTAFGASDSVDSCEPCAAGTYLTEISGVRTCVACPSNSVSLPGSDGQVECKCAPGFTGSNLVCTECEIGKYKPSEGSQPCLVCPDGYVGVSGMPTGELRLTIAGSCVSCGIDTYTQDLVTCAPCPVNSKSPMGSNELSNCVCSVGFTGTDGGPCQACETGKYKSELGDAACSVCPVNTWQNLTASIDANSCVACDVNSVSPEGSGAMSDCQCKSGYTGPNGGPCVACTDGSYKALTGDAPCALCSTGTYYQGSAPYTSNQCMSCGANTVTTAPAGVGVESCVCVTGNVKEDNACRPCQEGFYCPSETQETSCYFGSSSPVGSSAIDDCVCLPGYYANCTGGSCHHSCLLCPVNHYCPGSSDTATPCPADSTTLTQIGANASDACVCNPGWHEQEDACLLCDSDSFCANGKKAACPPNSTALAGTGSVAQCFCDAGFTRDAAGLCQACGPHLVCEGVQTTTVYGETVLQSGSVYVCGFGAINENQRCVCASGTSCAQGTSNASCVSPSTCIACAAGFYCVDNLRSACAVNETSLPDSNAASDCHCKTGYYRVDGLCMECPMGSYCMDETQYLCSAFDAPLTTIASGQSSPEACVCLSGNFRLFANDTCKSCPTNFFCPSETSVALPNAVSCGSNAYTDGGGHASHSACKCHAGFVLNSEADSYMKCLPCPAGHRCSDGEVLEFFCHIQNRTANADHSKCVCFAGFEEDANGECAPCSPGFFKADIGDHACAPCNNNRFYVNETTCGSCNVNESSSTDFLSCVCDAPLVRRGGDGLCVGCAMDQYFSSVSGVGFCESCPAHSSTNGLERQSDISSCACVAGYIDVSTTASEIVCEPCPSGTYEVGGTCVACGTNAISTPGSTSVDACVCNATICQQFVWGDACSGACEVAPDPCAECDPGHYKNFVSALGNTDACLQCDSGHYQPASGHTACIACHATRTNPALGAVEAEACVCQQGYEELDPSPVSACSPCAPGHFKSDIGDFPCTECLIGFFVSESQGTTCLSCAAHAPVTHANTTLSIGSTHADNCTCLKGYMFESGDGDGVCVVCQQGSYKSSPGDHVCRLCGEDIPIHAEHDTSEQFNTYGDGQQAAFSDSHCVQCPLFSGQDPLVVTYTEPMDDVSACLCFPAHTAFDASSGCVRCADVTGADWTANYSFKIGYSNAPCQLCSTGEYFIAANEVCRQCELPDSANATRKHLGVTLNIVDPSYAWGTDFNDCDCDLGHTRVVDECHPCATGNFRNDSLDRACYPCGLNEYQDATGQTQCKACPPHSYTEAIGSDSVLQCLCEGGYEWDEVNSICVPCGEGTSKARGLGSCEVCPENTYSLAQSPVCTPCGLNERSPAGSGSPFACNCRPGFGSADDGGSCSLCNNGTYSSGGAISTGNPQVQRPACLQCPTNKNSTQGSTERGNCKCIPGHGDPTNNADDGAECSPCENGFYASGGNNIACFSCGFGTVTEPPQAAFAFSCCQCDAARGLYEK